MLGLDAPSHWAILIIAALILFGYKKLPEMSRSVGRSLRIFKTEMKGLTDDDTARDAAEGSKAEQSGTPAVPVAPVSQQVPPVIVPPSLGADTNPAVPGGQPTQAAAEASRETPQQPA
jgi:sec-independent protein translocase protein TatA